MNALTKVVLVIYFFVIVSFVCYLCATFNHSYETDKEHTDQVARWDTLKT